nr:MAG TPA: hypothetical protein [Caudoviricetes sp.]
MMGEAWRVPRSIRPFTMLILLKCLMGIKKQPHTKKYCGS